MVYPLLFRVYFLVGPAGANLADFLLYNVVNLLLDAVERLLLLFRELAFNLGFDPIKRVQSLGLVSARYKNLLEDLRLSNLFLL